MLCRTWKRHSATWSLPEKILRNSRESTGVWLSLPEATTCIPDVQRADDVVVVLPAKAGEKHFSPEQKVKLINPRITTDGYKIGERGFVNYILLADDMLPAESK